MGGGSQHIGHVHAICIHMFIQIDVIWCDRFTWFNPYLHALTYLIGILDYWFVDICGENMIVKHQHAPPWGWIYTVVLLYLFAGALRNVSQKIDEKIRTLPNSHPHFVGWSHSFTTRLVGENSRWQIFFPPAVEAETWSQKVGNRGMICTNSRENFFFVLTHSYYIYIVCIFTYIYIQIYIERERKKNNDSKFLVWGLHWQYHTFSAVVTVVVVVFKCFCVCFFTLMLCMVHMVHC